MQDLSTACATKLDDSQLPDLQVCQKGDLLVHMHSVLGVLGKTASKPAAVCLRLTSKRVNDLLIRLRARSASC